MVMEDTLHELYVGAKCTTLNATILLIDLYMVHKVSNYFVEELLIIKQSHILLQNNLSPKNHYVANLRH